MRPWKVDSSEMLIETSYLAVEKQVVTVANGTVIDGYHIIHSPDRAATIAVTEENELLLVRQYRHAYGGTSLELPAGTFEKGEDPITAASREFEEETGYSSDDFELLWSDRPEPVRHMQKAHFVVAKNIKKAGAQNLDDTEEIDVVLRPLSELDAIVSEMIHGMHIAALLLAVRKGHISG